MNTLYLQWEIEFCVPCFAPFSWKCWHTEIFFIWGSNNGGRGRLPIAGMMTHLQNSIIGTKLGGWGLGERLMKELTKLNSGSLEVWWCISWFPRHSYCHLADMISVIILLSSFIMSALLWDIQNFGQNPVSISRSRHFWLDQSLSSSMGGMGYGHR